MTKLYNPFINSNFGDDTCFLTGEKLEQNSFITVFPYWAMERFDLFGRAFKMMDNFNSINYEDMKLPCTPEVRDKFDKLETEIRIAIEKGYDAIKELDEIKLFWWAAKIVYGTLYIDLTLEKEKQDKTKKDFILSETLRERLGYFHLMLQSIITPIEFEERKPWSISLVKLKYKKDVFNYHDDTINLIFSLGMKGIGLIICLQDNGLIKKHYEEILEKIGETVMHPIQFEELYSKFLYSNYLLKNKPEFELVVEGDKNKIKLVKEEEAEFGQWDDFVFSPVLAEYWKPWGIEMEKIYRPPNNTLSFLENETDFSYIDPESIDQPY